MVAINHEKKPFDDKRASGADPRPGSLRGLEGAVADRHREGGAGSRFGDATHTPPDELAKLAGYGKDINAARRGQEGREAGARRVRVHLQEPWHPMPYEPLAIWLIDQWRQVGLNVKHEVVESAAYYDQALRPGNFDVAMDFQCGYIVEPDLDLYKFVSTDKNPSNYGRYTDRTLDELFEKQTRATDPEERKKYVRAFEKRLLDEEVHYLMTPSGTASSRIRRR